MSVLGIDQITYGADDLPTCRRFFEDWGLALKSESARRTRLRVPQRLSGRALRASSDADLPPAMEEGPTLREVVWGVEREADLERYAAAIANDPAFFDASIDGARRIGCIDPNGTGRAPAGEPQTHAVEVDCGAMNTWNAKPRLNQPAPIYERATPIEVGHVVFFVGDVKATSAFYAERFGFVGSDSYPEPRRLHALRARGRPPRPVPAADPLGQARAQPRGLHRARHPRGASAAACTSAPGLGHAARPGPAPGLLGLLLVFQEPGRRPDRVLR